jgi:hypothetical protein
MAAPFEQRNQKGAPNSKTLPTRQPPIETKKPEVKTLTLRKP